MTTEGIRSPGLSQVVAAHSAYKSGTNFMRSGKIPKVEANMSNTVHNSTSSTMIDQLAKDIFNDIKKHAEKAKEHFSEQTSSEGGPSSQIKSIIESALKRMNLVTREEFDAQQAVLLRTREKLDALEKKILELESSLESDS